MTLAGALRFAGSTTRFDVIARPGSRCASLCAGAGGTDEPLAVLSPLSAVFVRTDPHRSAWCGGETMTEQRSKEVVNG